MFTITRKLGVVVAVAVAGAALSSSGVASAASIVRSPGTIARPVVSAPVTVATEAGSAGIPGYDDQKCEDLASDVREYQSRYEDAVNTANNTGGAAHQEAVNDARSYLDDEIAAQQELSDNCLVID